TVRLDGTEAVNLAEHGGEVHRGRLAGAWGAVADHGLLEPDLPQLEGVALGGALDRVVVVQVHDHGARVERAVSEDGHVRADAEDEHLLRLAVLLGRHQHVLLAADEQRGNLRGGRGDHGASPFRQADRPLDLSNIHGGWVPVKASPGIPAMVCCTCRGSTATEGSTMRTMWLIVDDPDGFDPVGWDADPTITLHDYTYEPLDADVEEYGEA